MTTKYEYVPDENDAALECIKLLEGKYKGLIYQYGSVGFNEDEENDSASLHFDYRIVEDVKNSKPNELQTILGDILVDILEEHASDIQSSIKLETVEGNDDMKVQIETALEEIENVRDEENTTD